MPGPPPKAPGQRRRRNKVAGARTLVPVDAGALEPPQLSERPDGASWHPAAVAYWNAIWQSPMSTEFDASDVHSMVRLLDLVHTYWHLAAREVRTKVLLAAEIRLESQNFGLSPLDRRRLQWEIERAESAQADGRRRTAHVVDGSDPRLSQSS